MASVEDILQMCRLCLVKEQVNVPIFDEPGEVRQIFLKITACLPVKLSREDNLPKKICDGCLYKLDLLYQFSNTSTNAEKQLLSWLSAAGLDPNTKDNHLGDSNLEVPPVVLKQEPITDIGDGISETQNYLLQQQQLPYDEGEELFQPATTFNDQIASSSAANQDIEEPAAKRPRRAAAIKAQPNLSHIDSDEEMDDPEPITKTEEESEEEDEEDLDNEPTFVNVAEEDDQPGPSGIGKITTEAPISIILNKSYKASKSTTQSKPSNRKQNKTLFNSVTFNCELCPARYFAKHGLKNHMAFAHYNYKCDECNEKFETEDKLEEHFEKQHLSPKDDIGSVTIFGDDDPLTIPLRNIEKELKKAKKNANKETEVVEGEFNCIICKLSCINLEELRKHQLIHTQLKKSYFCTQCPAVYFIKAALDMHKSVHLNLACNLCEMKFKTPELLKIHIYFKHENVIADDTTECITCKTKLLSRNQLIQHVLRNHLGIMQPEEEEEEEAVEKNCMNRCDICDQTFADKIHLTNHLLIKQMKLCHLCPKKYKHQNHLNQHIKRVHLTKRYNCNKCRKIFLSREKLKKHDKTHEVEIPCEFCGITCRSEFNLKMHLVVHGPDYTKTQIKCQFCDRVFTTKVGLILHEKRHNVVEKLKCDETFYCETCDITFDTLEVYNLHMKLHSDEMVEDETDLKKYVGRVLLSRVE